MGLSVTFWFPFLALATALYFFFQTPMQKVLNDRIHSDLRATVQILQERSIGSHEALIQLASQKNVADALQHHDTAALKTMLMKYSNRYAYTTLLLAVDINRTVVARRNNRTGDQIDIGETLPRTLLLGEPRKSLELVSRDLLARDNKELQALFWDLGLVQVFTAPVTTPQGKVLGALVGGILLSDETWVSNTVYNRIGVEMAIFAGNPSESTLLHATSSLPRNIWKIGQLLPIEAERVLSLGHTFTGLVTVDGNKITAAYEPLMDSRNRIIGAIGVSSSDDNISSIIQYNILRGMLVAALLGLIIALIIVWFVYRDITRPLNILTDSMQRFGHGEADVNIDLQTGDQFEDLGTAFNDMAEEINQREERMRKHNEVAKLLMSTLQLDELLDQTLRLIVEISDSAVGSIHVMNTTLNQLIPRAYYGIRMSGDSLQFGEGFPGRAAKDQKMILVESPDSQGHMDMELGLGEGKVTHLAYIPLVFQDRCLGVISLGRNKCYHEDETLLFDYVADQISIALENALMHKRIHELSICDGLTGLYNRRHLSDQMKQLWLKCQREKMPFSVLLADADNFKSVNDNYGHDRGDEVLVAIANIFQDCRREQDLVARYGGEEFVYLMPDTTHAEAMEVAVSIENNIRSHQYEWKDGPVTLSIGLATATMKHKFPNGDALLQAADKAMYQAKSQGKDRVVSYDDVEVAEL